MKPSGRCFLRAHRSCVPEATKLIPQAGSRTGWYKSHPGGSGFEGTYGSWRAAKARHCEKSGEAIGQVETSAAVESPGLQGSCREVEGGHHEESS